MYPAIILAHVGEQRVRIDSFMPVDTPGELPIIGASVPSTHRIRCERNLMELWLARQRMVISIVRTPAAGRGLAGQSQQRRQRPVPTVNTAPTPTLGAASRRHGYHYVNKQQK